MSGNLARAVAACVCVAVIAAGCHQTPADSNANNFVTADKTFTVHSVDTYQSGPGDAQLGQIVVVTVTYTNPDVNNETITPSKFALIDLTTQATYLGLSGGDIHVPSMPNASLEPSKSIDLQIAFRVPTTLGPARLVYRVP